MIHVRKIAGLLLVLALVFPLSASARGDLSAQRLVEGCTEVVTLYKARERSRLLAGQLSSMQQAVQAGYCIGVVQYYKSSNYCNRDWYEVATRIAMTEQLTGQSHFGLLRNACE
ncbi:hypothetical protein SAMN05660443_2062 [Marinospirillum celere]|uniref:Uncharacterized protein n=1 Tax=Marinospirillum celere TaxID=1122252 RepID=A0A1I1HXJ5_9GAMM|nr:hypothetical protein [Marinospirillum celere]SFC28282.1 hypothetical protein SAMN05660443_2062 [Marinospirillum celere]